MAAMLQWFVTLVTVARSMRMTVKDSESEQCAIEQIGEFTNVLGCGNNGCVFEVSAPTCGTETVLKFGKPSQGKGEVLVLEALGKLGLAEPGCSYGTASSSGPCVLTPNTIRICSSGECACGDLPADAETRMLEKAESYTNPITRRAMPKETSWFKSGRTKEHKPVCSSLLIQRIHSDLAQNTINGIKTRSLLQGNSEELPLFGKAMLLQMYFAYHVTFTKLGFVHNDINYDNLGLGCMTTFQDGVCAAPAAGEMVYCFSFESGGAQYCVDLADTGGYVLKLIDFGLSKLSADSIPRSEKVQGTMVSRKFGIECDYLDTFLQTDGPGTKWIDIVKDQECGAFFADFLKAEVPAGAKVFGF